MNELEKVISGLACCTQNVRGQNTRPCDGCPYDEDGKVIACNIQLMVDALELLKAQEPVEPIAKNRAYFCGNPCCGRILADMVPSGAPTHKIKYCSECGKAVKWK